MNFLSEMVLPEGCPQHKAQLQKLPESYSFLHRTSGQLFPAGDVFSFVGAEGVTTLAHDLKCLHPFPMLLFNFKVSPLLNGQVLL